MQQNPLANFNHKDFEIKSNNLCDIINQFILITEIQNDFKRIKC